MFVFAMLYCLFISLWLLTVLLLVFNADLSLVRFIRAELTRGYFLEHNEAKYTERRERVYTCLRIPKELEKVGGLWIHTVYYAPEIRINLLYA